MEKLVNNLELMTDEVVRMKDHIRTVLKYHGVNPGTDHFYELLDSVRKVKFYSDLIWSISDDILDKCEEE